MPIEKNTEQNHDPAILNPSSAQTEKQCKEAASPRGTPLVESEETIRRRLAGQFGE